MLVTAANNIRVSHFPNMDQLDAYNMNGDEIINVSWSKNNVFMMYLERNGRPQILSLKDRKNIKVIHVITAIDYATTALFSRNRNGMVAIGTSLGTVALYDTHSKAIVKLYDVPGPVVSMDFNQDDRFLAVVCKSGQVLILDVCAHKKVFSTDIQETPTTVRFHPCAPSFFGLCTASGKFIYMNAAQEEPVWAVTVAALKALVAFAFNPKEDRQQIVTIDDEYKVSTYETLAGKCLFRCCLQQGLTDVDYSKDGRYYAVAMDNGKVCVFEATNPRTPVTVLDVHDKRPIHCLRFSNVTHGPNTNSWSSSQSATLTCDTPNSTVRPTSFNGSDITPSTIQSFLSQESVAVVLDGVRRDIICDVMKCVLYLNAHVQNQLAAFDDFVRKECDTIDLQVQKKWDIVRKFRETTRQRRGRGDSDDDGDDNLLRDPKGRGKHDIIILE